MDFHLNEEQHMMRQMVRDFAKKEVAPVVREMEVTDQFPLSLVKRMGEIGLLGIPIPERYGGSGMDVLSYILTIEELSKVSPTLGVILSVHTSAGTNPILYFGHEDQKQKYIPRLANGEYIGAFAVTESSVGSDAASLQTRARREGNHYILNGSKMFITNGSVADTFIVFAKTAPDKGGRGISAFIVERQTAGLTIGKAERKMGLHGSSSVPLIFDEVKVPVENRLGEEGQGFKVAMTTLNIGRIGIAAQALGIAEGAYEHALDYANQRKQFGKPLIKHQGIGFKLADLATGIEAARLLVYQAADLVMRGESCSKEASMAKLFASQTAVKTAIEAVQVFGGYGYTEDYPVERYFRDAKITEIYEGTSEIQRIVISKQLLK
ncbi:alkylation response protein AidB-like acyl-CoA dehydrogenase [Pullulanibacillus pueri]|uniref:Acyl-CoA dehydrogenase n=1 Tax=Pullulanibacillus pueri TaxID=1437324 RepID=A0A8J3EN76_9BACL|nr:acyl-CoA dehydrogenase [Pullulanibacillus pueri]MBM7681700.1 alkylation response protein AidB-like acyl-CoA dehydrogenase [Pullulanibacillus pueri]GGH87055.1 acyl-CoA dehydrogenase [Pullulanibacillus pueri]